MGNKHIKSIHRVIDIIEEIQVNRGSRIKDLAQTLDMNKSTIHTHLATLQNRGYVTKNSDDEYHLDFQFFVLGGGVRDYRSIFNDVRPILLDIANETGEIVSYVIESNGKMIFLADELGENAIRTKVHPGFCTELHTSPEGQALLAHLSNERRNSILSRINYNNYPGLNRSGLEEELETIRDQGFTYGSNSVTENVTAISAPVVDNNDVLHGAIVIAGPTIRFDEDVVSDYIELLLEKIAHFNVNISYKTSDTSANDYVRTNQ